MDEIIMQEDRIPKVFISYAWSNQKFALRLAEKLAHDGIQVIIDEWETNYGHDMDNFMERCVKDDDITIARCD